MNALKQKLISQETLLIWLSAILVFSLTSKVGAQSLASDRQLSGIDFEQRLGSPLPLSLKLYSEGNQELSLSEALGHRASILVMAYSACPNLCSLVLDGLSQSVRQISRGELPPYNIIVASLDPTESDAAARAKRAKMLQTTKGSHTFSELLFVRSSVENIDRLASAIGFHYRYNPTTQEYLHPSGIVILTPQGKVSSYLFGIRYPARALADALLKASQNGTGSLAEKLLLYCFHYDPQTGRYGLIVVRAFQAAGVLTLLILALLFWRLKAKKP